MRASLHAIGAIALSACVVACESAPPVVGEAGTSPETCEVPPMQDLYPGPIAPDPYGDQPDAGACIAQKHDVVIILGCPSKDDGTASDCQIARADAAAALLDAGLGDRFIVSGGAVHTDHIEAEILRDLLVERGVDEDAITLEPLAEHTDENLYYSSLIMQDQGWRTAFVVSDDAGHLIYTALCDSNCCVDLGRMTVVELEPIGAVGHYVLYPDAEPVSEAECRHIEDARLGMCVNLGWRRACKEDFQL